MAVRWMNPIGSRRPPPASTYAMLYGGSTVLPVERHTMLAL